MSIRNIVFDIGNVFVRWAPEEIIRLTFGLNCDKGEISPELFQSAIWKSLNKGEITEGDASLKYQNEFNWSNEDCQRFFYYVKATQLEIYGTFELAIQLKEAGYSLYALTDNVNEIVDFLKRTFEFWPIFDGTTVSAEVGILKPAPEIYRKLLSMHGITASETVFIDDMPYNIEGAESQGIAGIQFSSADQCAQDLRDMGVNF